ncbi:hypothetical protein CsSME_00017867 [Camellia sinensis var. sinensis]
MKLFKPSKRVDANFNLCQEIREMVQKNWQCHLQVLCGTKRTLGLTLWRKKLEIHYFPNDPKASGVLISSNW